MSKVYLFIVLCCSQIAFILIRIKGITFLKKNLRFKPPHEIYIFFQMGGPIRLRSELLYITKVLFLTKLGLGSIIIFILNIFVVTVCIVAGSIYSKNEFLISQIIISFFGNNLFLV